MFVGFNDQEIYGLYQVTSNRYITYLFSDTASPLEVEMLLSDAKEHQHLEGTVVDPLLTCFKKHYKVDENIQEIACLDLSKANDFIRSPRVRALTIEDMDIYIDAIGDIFGDFIDEDRYLRNLKLQTFYGLFIDDKLVASASMSGGSSLNRVMVSVFTIEEYQRQGLGCEVVSDVLARYQDDTKNISIFFQNPIAKDLYLKLGFELQAPMKMFKRK